VGHGIEHGTISTTTIRGTEPIFSMINGLGLSRGSIRKIVKEVPGEKNGRKPEKNRGG